MNAELSLFLIDEQSTLIQAMKRLDKNARKVVFVTRQGRLIASLSDGDIRRWILKNGSMEATVAEMCNYAPKSVRQDEWDSAYELLEKHCIDAVPVIDDDGRVVDLCLRDAIRERSAASALDTPVVIMAGGKGTRLYPYTKILPKPLIPIGELPISEHIINRFYEQGCTQFYMILNYKKNMIKAYFGETEHPYSLETVDETTPLGTGGGLSLLRGKLNRTFLFTNCDTLITESLTKALRDHREQGNAITMICSMKNFVIPYGVVHLDDSGCIADMQEKPSLPFLTNTGTCIVEPDVLELIPDHTAMSFPDVITECLRLGRKVSVYPVSEDHWLDMGQIGEMENMKRRLGVNE